MTRGRPPSHRGLGTIPERRKKNGFGSGLISWRKQPASRKVERTNSGFKRKKKLRISELMVAELARVPTPVKIGSGTHKSPTRPMGEDADRIGVLEPRGEVSTNQAMHASIYPSFTHGNGVVT